MQKFTSFLTDLCCINNKSIFDEDEFDRYNHDSHIFLQDIDDDKILYSVDLEIDNQFNNDYLKNYFNKWKTFKLNNNFKNQFDNYYLKNYFNKWKTFKLNNNFKNQFDNYYLKNYFNKWKTFKEDNILFIIN